MPFPRTYLLLSLVVSDRRVFLSSLARDTGHDIHNFPRRRRFACNHRSPVCHRSVAADKPDGYHGIGRTLYCIGRDRWPTVTYRCGGKTYVNIIVVPVRSIVQSSKVESRLRVAFACRSVFRLIFFNASAWALRIITVFFLLDLSVRNTEAFFSPFPSNRERVIVICVPLSTGQICENFTAYHANRWIILCHILHSTYVAFESSTITQFVSFVHSY